MYYLPTLGPQEQIVELEPMGERELEVWNLIEKLLD